LIVTKWYFNVTLIDQRFDDENKDFKILNFIFEGVLNYVS